MWKALDKHLNEHIINGTNMQVMLRDKLISTNTSGETGVTRNNNKWRT